MFPRLVLLLLAANIAASAGAQTPPALITDRPDFTESGVVVPLGHVQVELGASWEWTQFVLPENLFRWTPADRFELRLSAPSYAIETFEEGFLPGSLGAKYQVGSLGAWDLGLIASIGIPVDDEVDQSDAFDPEFILTVGRDLTSNISLGGQVMVSRDGEADAWQYGGTLVAGLGLSERLGAFIEGMVVDERRNTMVIGDPRNNVLIVIHHGYTYLISPGLQLDIHGGLGFSNAEEDVQAVVGVGLSVLL